MADQVEIGFSFASDWFREWWEFSKPITWQRKLKPMQSQSSFDKTENCSNLVSVNFNQIWFLLVPSSDHMTDLNSLEQYLREQQQEEGRLHRGKCILT